MSYVVFSAFDREPETVDPSASDRNPRRGPAACRRGSPRFRFGDRRQCDPRIEAPPKGQRELRDHPRKRRARPKARLITSGAPAEPSGTLRRIRENRTHRVKKRCRLASGDRYSFSRLPSASTRSCLSSSGVRERTSAEEEPKAGGKMRQASACPQTAIFTRRRTRR